MSRLSPRPIPAPSPLPRSSRKLLPPSFLLQLGRRASSATASDRRTSTASSVSSAKQLTHRSSSAVTTASAWTISGETASASPRDDERDDERDESLGFQPGDRLVHVKHGLGVAVGYLPDGRLEIAFDDGQRHKYRPPSVARKIARAPTDAPGPEGGDEYEPEARVTHVSHGLGVVLGYLPDGRLEIAFDDGQRHKYKAPSVARKIAPAPADAPPPPPTQDELREKRLRFFA